MITNERQYKITKSQLAKIQSAIESYDINNIENNKDSLIIALAELNALRSQEDELRNQILEYETLKSGTLEDLEARSIEELPYILIKARIIQNLTQRDLAKLVGLKEQQIQRYEAGLYSSAKLSRLSEISDALGINISEIATVNQEKIQGKKKKEKGINWKKFPIKEMYKRGWFEGFSDSLDSLLYESDAIIKDYITREMNHPSLTLYRKNIRSGSKLNSYSLLAWECRVRKLSKQQNNIGKFHIEKIDSEWISELVKASAYSDGPIRARDMLLKSGISFVIEPHLANTYLDGAVLLNDSNPIIGMTLRYDRLDNFWFVLLHELMHLKFHVSEKQIDSVFDDLDSKASDEIEIEADRFAGEALIPEHEWNRSLVKFIQSEELIIDLSKKLNVTPAIIAGRIRHDNNNYAIFNSLVGQGEVRKLFSEVKFGG